MIYPYRSIRYEEKAVARGDYEKSESWYIVEAGPEAYISAGMKTEDVGEIQRAIAGGRLEELLVRIPVKAGDFAMIPAGMVHACGKDILALEVGSFGGITYRLYDYGRGRKLDLEQGLAALKPQLRCHIRHVEQNVHNSLQEIGRHGLFGVGFVNVYGEWWYEGYESYRILTCVGGACDIRWGEEACRLEYTETLVVPAACSKILVAGRAQIIVSWGSQDRKEAE